MNEKNLCRPISPKAAEIDIGHSSLEAMLSPNQNSREHLISATTNPSSVECYITASQFQTCWLVKHRRVNMYFLQMDDT